LTLRIGRGRRRRPAPATLVFLAAGLILVFIVIAPLARLVLSSFQEPRGGALTLANYIAAYGTPRRITALLNTLAMGSGVVVLSTIFAAPLAWACSRTDMPGRGFVRLAVVGAFVTPPYLAAIAWILLAGPNAGWINRLWFALGADHHLVNVFSVWGIVLVMSTNLFFYLFVYLTSALEMVSSESEEAANILGASVIQTALRITFPLILPALLGGLVVIFLGAFLPRRFAADSRPSCGTWLTPRGHSTRTAGCAWVSVDTSPKSLNRTFQPEAFTFVRPRGFPWP